MRLFLAAVTSVLALPLSAQSQIVPRIELHSFTSQTPTNEQFLTGARDAPTVTLGGELRLPRAGADKLPAACSFIRRVGSPRTFRHGRSNLSGMGIATFTVDSFTGHRINNTVNDQDALSRLAMIIDAYRALDLIATHPRIDATHIAVMGLSRGGGAAHWSAIERFQQMHGPETARFALHIALYPTCNRDFKDALKTTAPIRIIHGKADDYIPIKECRELVGRLRASGRDASILEIDEAYHNFDNPAGAVVKVAGPQTTRNCPMIREGDDGVLVNSLTGKPFTYASDPCVERGVTVGRDPSGRELAQKAVREMMVQAGFAK